MADKATRRGGGIRQPRLPIDPRKVTAKPQLLRFERERLAKVEREAKQRKQSAVVSTAVKISSADH